MATVDPNNRNADLDAGLPGRMFSGIVTGTQDSHRREQEAAAERAAAAQTTTQDS